MQTYLSGALKLAKRHLEDAKQDSDKEEADYWQHCITELEQALYLEAKKEQA